jgi:hypothetical protein
VFQNVSCAVLLALPGGCSHDLSLLDTTVAAGTRAGDVCPHECGGHAGCAPSVLDVGFLGSMDDSSGNGAQINLIGGACVDGGAVTFSGDGHIEMGTGADCARDGSFTLAFWLLKSKARAHMPVHQLTFETIYEHPVSRFQLQEGIVVSLRRGTWLSVWSLVVNLDGSGVETQLELIRDATPVWTHVSAIVDESYATVHENGNQLPTHVPTVPYATPLQGNFLASF